MKSAVVVFPASNCDRDVAVAIRDLTGHAPMMVWHGDARLPEELDLIVLPGGFSHGDYLRCGAIAARAPIMADVVARARSGVPTLGICNGFQVLTEAGLLPGVLMRNAGLTFISRSVHLKVEATRPPFLSAYRPGDVIRVPVAHHDGNYFADDDTLARIEGEGQVALRYCRSDGRVDDGANINGSRANIAGVTDQTGRILGMMPHPERAVSAQLGSEDGARLFAGLGEVLAA